jgi:L-lactate dehydrogenase complex protein LldG
MKAREEILKRLEKAPRSPKLSAFTGEAPQSSAVVPKEERLELFLMRLRQNGATVMVLEEGGELAVEGLLKLLKDEGAKKVLLSGALGSLLREPLEKALRDRGILGILAPEREEELKREALLADAGVSVARWGIAQLGVLVLVHGPDNPRLLSLAPPLSVVVLHAEDILGGLEELAGESAISLSAGSQVTLVSGPSQSADIQGVPFFGMHGPKKLIVALLARVGPRS